MSSTKDTAGPKQDSSHQQAYKSPRDVLNGDPNNLIKDPSIQPNFVSLLDLIFVSQVLQFPMENEVTLTLQLQICWGGSNGEDVSVLILSTPRGGSWSLDH